MACMSAQGQPCVPPCAPALVHQRQREARCLAPFKARQAPHVTSTHARAPTSSQTLAALAQQSNRATPRAQLFPSRCCLHVHPPVTLREPWLHPACCSQCSVALVHTQPVLGGQGSPGEALAIQKPCMARVLVCPQDLHSAHALAAPSIMGACVQRARRPTSRRQSSFPCAPSPPLCVCHAPTRLPMYLHASGHAAVRAALRQAHACMQCVLVGCLSEWNGQLILEGPACLCSRATNGAHKRTCCVRWHRECRRGLLPCISIISIIIIIIIIIITRHHLPAPRPAAAESLAGSAQSSPLPSPRRPRLPLSRRRMQRSWCAA